MGLNTDIRHIAREVFRHEIEQLGLLARTAVAPSARAEAKADTPARSATSGASRDGGGPPALRDGGASDRPALREAGHLVPRAPPDLSQPNFDAPEAAWFLRYATMKAFYQAVRRYGIPHVRRGQRVMLFRRADLEKFLASRSRGRWTSGVTPACQESERTMGVEKYTTPGGKIAWMVDLTATLPNGREVRFRKRKIPTKEQAKALEAKTLKEIFDDTYFENRRRQIIRVKQL